MATAYRSEYVTLGGLIMGSRAIDCYDWSDLMGSAGKRGDDFVAQGVAGVTERTRTEDALRALLHVRVNARYDQDNVRVAASSARANLYTLLAAVRAKAEVNTTQTLSLTASGGPYSADAVVVGGFQPRHHSPYIVTFTLDVLLPDGGLI